MIVVAGPALVLAGVGVTHPQDLNGGSASWWTTLHLLGTIGTWCFLVACLATSSALIFRAGRGAMPGAVVLSVAAVSFLHSHIYWPVGVLTMLAMAAGLGLLALAVPADEQAEAALSP